MKPKGLSGRRRNKVEIEWDIFTQVFIEKCPAFAIFSRMVYGQTRMLHDRRHRIVVFLERPSAAALPREAQGPMGGPRLFPRVQNERNVQCRLAKGQRNPEIGYQVPGTNGLQTSR
jgi:hypothetical protein